MVRRCLNTKGKYGKLTDTEIKWSIISKSVMIIIFVEFIDKLIDYPINCASLRKTYILTCVPNEDSDQPVHPWLSKIRPLRLWLDCANAQADLNLHWAHMIQDTSSGAAADKTVAGWYDYNHDNCHAD